MTEFFETAQAIGARLCRDAIWSNGRCNWIGASMESVAGWTVVQKSFGPDLYSGTSGIGILLAELAALNNERLFRKVAEGAACQALSRAADIPPQMRAGFYSGHAGIAYAVGRIGERLGNEGLIERGLALMESLTSIDLKEHGTDVVSGVAGAIPALLLMHRKSGRQSLLDLAISCAQKLEETAHRGDDGWSWKTIETPGEEQRDLTGFSHGTAGIGWALLELSHAIGEKRYRQSAEEVFRYERHWFNAEQGNWPDFRKDIDSPAEATAGPTYGVAWCHGAPGIGLSRLRAFEITGDDACAREADIAAQTTMRYLSMPQVAQAGYSLCHGCAGNADFLLEAARVLDKANYRLAAEQTARQGIAWFEAKRSPWPCGVLGGAETPNLLLGTAGIALFYLRLEHAAQVLPVLMVGPRARS
jgi:type 2 lantibiotic biosynthesis protein LanM